LEKRKGERERGRKEVLFSGGGGTSLCFCFSLGGLGGGRRKGKLKVAGVKRGITGN